MWYWNNVNGSGFNFYIARDTDGTHNNGNGVNEIYWDNLGATGPLAVTMTKFYCYWLVNWEYGMTEADIAFNADYQWSNLQIDYNSITKPYRFEGVALHEFGHALGLNHENRTLATMNSIYPNGGTVGDRKIWDVLPEDRRGVRFLHSDPSTEVDLAASIFRNDGTGNAKVNNSSALSATRGSSISVQYTILNQSTSSQVVSVGFYLSSDRNLTTADTLIAVINESAAWTFPAGVAATYSSQVAIPLSITPGTYYVGYIVDHKNTLVERNERNNKMLLRRRITIN